MRPQINWSFEMHYFMFVFCVWARAFLRKPRRLKTSRWFVPLPPPLLVLPPCHLYHYHLATNSTAKLLPQYCHHTSWTTTNTTTTSINLAALWLPPPPSWCHYCHQIKRLNTFHSWLSNTVRSDFTEANKIIISNLFRNFNVLHMHRACLLLSSWLHWNSLPYCFLINDSKTTKVTFRAKPLLMKG